MKTMALTILCLMSLMRLTAAEDLTVFHAANDSPQAQLTAYLDAIAHKELDRRKSEIAAITTREQAARRQKVVREKVLALIGGLPNYHGPLNTRAAGVLEHDGYRIEKVIYESLPHFYVTANVYVPTRGTPPFPAVLMPIGHWEGGKEGDREIAIGLALKGFIALEYDPIGQGERVQYYDEDLGGSKVGPSTAQHSHANGQTLLIGDSIARYRIFDGIRSIDYLQSRHDVDPQRIGCAGCSGGGTLTAYISALDDRVKAAVAACYINTWADLLAGPGPQDGEQVFPRFLAEGLDIPDFVEAFAPKPWLIESTREDFFPLAGAEHAYQEAKRFYTVYGAADRISWFVGPGGHGVPPVSREAIFSWFIRWLKNGDGDPKETPVKLDPPHDLLCTPTGQIATSLGGETVYSLNKARAVEIIAPYGPVAAADVRRLAGITIQPGGAAPSLTVLNSYARSGYKLEVVSYEAEPGIRIPGLLLTPNAGGRRPAALVVDPRSKQSIAGPGGDLEDLVNAGYVVLAIQPRGIPEAPQRSRTVGILGDYRDAARAYLVGKTLAGMRAEDIIRAVDYLCSRQDVDRARIGAIGRGELGVPLLHAALIDSRIGRLVLEQTPASYRAAVDHPVTREVYDVLIPGVLKKYDLPNLVAALKPRPVVLLNPVDQLGNPLATGRYRAPGDPLHEFLQ
jgi:cephalosporin-C deacetylase-like acetyl esterase